MIDFEQAFRYRDWRSAGADAASLPFAGSRKKVAVRPPVHKVRRTSNPHLRPAKLSSTNWPVQRDIFSVNPLGQEDEVFIFRTKNNSMPFERLEISRRSEC